MTVVGGDEDGRSINDDEGTRNDGYSDTAVMVAILREVTVARMMTATQSDEKRLTDRKETEATKIYRRLTVKK